MYKKIKGDKKMKGDTVVSNRCFFMNDEPKVKIGSLTDNEVEENREKYGSNKLPEKKPVTFWDAFKETFGEPMIKLLLVIAGLMTAMFFFGYAEIYEPIGIAIAILIVAFVTAKTNVASDTAYRKQKESIKKELCKVYRNGVLTEVEIDDVVGGDYVVLQAGDKIPGDGVLIDGALSVNNSALNGETEESKKYPTSIDTELPDYVTGDTFTDKHSLFSGAVVYDGSGVMLVKRVGIGKRSETGEVLYPGTIMGQIALDMQEDEPESPLQVKLHKLADQISKFGYCGAGIITIAYLAMSIFMAGGFGAFFGQGFSECAKILLHAISIAASIVVCAVPEGLPLMIALVLMQNTKKMLDHNVLVRKAIGIETAGSLNILFSDKTGTITKGILEVVEVFTADNKPIISSASDAGVYGQVASAISHNTSSMFDNKHNVIGGNPTDQALLKFVGESAYSRIANARPEKSQGFNSSNKFSQSQINGRTYYVGAPEKLLAKAKTCLDSNGSITPIDFQLINDKLDALARKSMRLIAFGYSSSLMKENELNDDLVIVGFAAIRDDVRPEAAEAIAQVQGAGIQVVMITGDRKETAKAIAEDVGLVKSADDIVITSSELAKMSDDEVKKIMSNIRVIARAMPTDKSRMVKLCQEMNLVAGMTGDGVNDSPALNKSDVGFAMDSGTEAAKEASKIVLLDNNFRSIKDAIWYGRTIYHNILKFCAFQLTINIAAVVVSAIAPFIGINEPLKVTHLLFVNLVMDGLGALMLGNEPALEKYMKEPPRKRDESIINKNMLARLSVTSLWFIALSFIFLKAPFIVNMYGSTEQHMTGYFAFFILTALLNGFNVRDDGMDIFAGLDKNKSFLKIMCVIELIQICIINMPLIPFAPFQWIGKMFSCTPFGLTGWMIVVAFAITIIPVDIIRKAVCRK